MQERTFVIQRMLHSGTGRAVASFGDLAATRAEMHETVCKIGGTVGHRI